MKLLEAVMKGDPIRSAFDVCESELVDRIIKLVFKYYSDTHGSQEQFGIVNLVDTLVSSKIATLDNEDTNPLVSYFQTLCDLPDVDFLTLYLTPFRKPLKKLPPKKESMFS